MISKIFLGVGVMCHMILTGDQSQKTKNQNVCVVIQSSIVSCKAKASAGCL